MKKAIGSLILISALVLPNAALAEKNSDSSDKTSSIVIDTSKKPLKTFVPASLDSNKNGDYVTAASAPYWSATSGLYTLGGTWTKSDSYTSSSKTTRKAIDRIYAKTRHYVDGGLKGSKTDDQSNSSRAGTEVNNGKWIVGDDEVYGDHKFEEAGYQSWYPETYDT